jgi:23S rRNA (uracil1939-C5)-methyltransferase
VVDAIAVPGRLQLPDAGRKGNRYEAHPAHGDCGQLDEFEDVELYEAPVEMVLPALEGKPQLVVVDPPRAGLGRGVVDNLLKMRPPALVYISCDPATLARDARRLVEGGYRLEQVTPFDMFPQTYHIESDGG